MKKLSLFILLFSLLAHQAFATGCTSPTANNGDVVYGTNYVAALCSNGTWVGLGGAVSPIYPSSGIPNSSGSAWGTSYSTSGSGTVVPLATGATIATPTLSNPTVNAFTECSDAPTITAGAVTISNATCTFHKLSLVAGTTITLPAPSATNGSYRIQVCYGGAYTPVWAITSGTLSYPASGAPVATSISGTCDFYGFDSHDTSYTYIHDLGRGYTGS